MHYTSILGFIQCRFLFCLSFRTRPIAAGLDTSGKLLGSALISLASPSLQ